MDATDIWKRRQKGLVTAGRATMVAFGLIACLLLAKEVFLQSAVFAGSCTLIDRITHASASFVASHGKIRTPIEEWARFYHGT